ncbi:unnamed protein product [Adineta ricciae]|uniref:Uncharacterized protein n=1 Tax=Adineta ricciae TaxID=249248 RepID=A0A816BBG0_ADIRI|nr:unnamed protein product [Adineta ricciae]
MRSRYLIIFGFILIYTLNVTFAAYGDHKHRDPIDYTDDDVNRLFEQWEENDEDGSSKDDEDDPRKYQPKGPLTGKDPEKLFAQMKKGQATMVTALVAGNPTKRETEQIAQIWWMGLRNALYDVHKFVADNNKIIFGIDDGSRIYEIKEFLINQPECYEVIIDQQTFPGRGSKPKKSKLKEL